MQPREAPVPDDQPMMFPHTFEEDHIKVREQELSCRDVMLDEIQSKIALHRIKNMQKLS
jgi:hypothetical protein